MGQFEREKDMFEMILAICLAWGSAGLVSWQIRGSRLESLGLGLILLPISIDNVCSDFSVTRPVMAVSIVLGLAIFTMANKRRCSRTYMTRTSEIDKGERGS